jgi:hypothetical protein
VLTPSGLGVHLSGYQARDHDISDYQMAELPSTGLMFRGPLPETLGKKGGYFVCIGAAQTFGCFCNEPYPALVARKIGLPALNLGYGGAGPEFFLKHGALLNHINRARFVVLQVMSARSQSNSYYDCGGLEYATLRCDGRRMGAKAAFNELLTGPAAIRRLPLPLRVRRKLGNIWARPRARAIVNEIRAAWVASSLQLLERIEVPVVLFWFSKRPPEYLESYATAGRLLGEFPHLVTRQMLDEIRPHASDYTECVSHRGSPQKLVSRFTGELVTVSPANDRPDLAVEPWTENHYYPSPEMHEDAARALQATCTRLA